MRAINGISEKQEPVASKRRSARGHDRYRKSRHKEGFRGNPPELGQMAGVVIFAIIICIAPLAFGAVDRPWQIALTFLLAAGLMVAPVRYRPQRGLVTALAFACVAWFLVKDFLPDGWFGTAHWRLVARDNFGIVFPGTHHPEPGRSIDGILVMTAGAIWLLWVRSLASDARNRALLLWSMVVSGTVVALVSLFLRGDPALGIYGVRATPGWTGFGPFPNRNHTACLLAMASIAGLGVMVRSFRKGITWQTGITATCILAMLIALLESRSRGGLAALGVGGIAFSLAMLLRRHDRRTIAAVAGGILFVASLILAFGGPVLERLGSEQQGAVSTATRLQLWNDALGMWLSEPLTGHGLGSFASVFPFFMRMQAYGVVVLHPESSWLLWLVEAGGIVAVISLFLAVRFVVKRIPGLIRESHSFDLRIGAAAAVLVIITHSLWDVPAHRWATAWFGLAAFAIAFPASAAPGKRGSLGMWPALLAGAIAIFWMAPFFFLRPYFMPSTLDRLQARAISAPSQVPTEKLEKALAYYPLSASLHHLIGLRFLLEPGWDAAAIQQFRAADRLKPVVWSMPIAHARVLAPHSARAARHFWTLAIERGGHRAEEFFYLAWDASAKTAGGEPFWEGYAEANPYLLLSYAQKADVEHARAAFQKWWDVRAAEKNLNDFEITGFYHLVPSYGSETQLREWMRIHPERRRTDHEAWARMMAALGDAEGAWTLISENAAEPDYPQQRIRPNKDQLEVQWQQNPEDMLTGQALAEALEHAGERSRSEKLIMDVAARVNSPRWFRQKAGFILAREGRYKEAVNTFLSAQ